MKKSVVLIIAFWTILAAPVFIAADYDGEKAIYLDIVRNTPEIELPHKVFLMENFIKEHPASPFRGQSNCASPNIFKFITPTKLWN